MYYLYNINMGDKTMQIVKECADIFLKLENLDLDKKIEAINLIKKELHKHSPFKNEPVDCVLWIKNNNVFANDYNPNSVAPPEMKLLEHSIREDGYTQPIVAWDNGNQVEVIDGFHRNRVGREIEDIEKRINGYLPIVTINQHRQERNDRVASTIRHNRARGKHKIDSMSEIVVELKRRNWSDEKIGRELGMDADEAIKRNRKIGVLLVDLEGQYKLTIDHAKKMFEEYKNIIDLYWICLPIHLRNAVSVYEPHWICWDKLKKEAWIRDLPENAISDENYFRFFHNGMEFEEFVPEFGEWYAEGKKCACFVGIRSDESLNRYRTIASRSKIRYNNLCYTTKVTENVFNFYPIYDWKTQDIWIYHNKFSNKIYNKLYDYMHKAGLSISQMRICQPYGDDQRKGLWLFHLIEPETWAKVVARVNGANGGALYVQEWGNINGYRKITKPEGHTWKSFSNLLLGSMPKKTKQHFENKILLFRKWWIEKGYNPDIPDEAEYDLEQKRDVPSYRRICKALLRNDYWCKGLGFSQHKNEAYKKYLELMEKRKKGGFFNELFKI